MKEKNVLQKPTMFAAVLIAGSLLFGTVDDNLFKLFWGMMEEGSWELKLLSRYWAYKLLFGFGLAFTFFCMLFSLAVLAYRCYVLWFALERQNKLRRRNGMSYEGQTPNYLVVFLLQSFVPFSIYRFYWFYRYGNEMEQMGQHSGASVRMNGKKYLALLLIPAVIQWVMGLLVLVMCAQLESADYSSGLATLQAVGVLTILWKIMGVIRGAICFPAAWTLYLCDLERLEAYGNVVVNEVPAARISGRSGGYGGSYDSKPESIGANVIPGKGSRAPMPVRARESSTQIIGAVVVLTGEYKNVSIPVRNGEQIKLGRDASKCHLVFQNEHVSRLHCGVSFDPRVGVYRVTDYSTNGTFTRNGERLMKNTPQVCRKGTILRMGKSGEEFLLK